MRLLITAAFLVLAAWFALGSGSGQAPTGVRVNIDPADIDRAFTRELMGDPPSMDVAGMQLTCQDCHGIFDSGLEESEVRQQHGDIRLEHGLNARCFNCHSREDRNYLVLAGDVQVPFAEVQRVCAGCHGTTFRDWEKGIHGKSRGSWVVGSPEHQRMVCTECHDPHHPAFRPIVPLPAPQTLRMKATERNPVHIVHDERNPLRIRAGSGDATHTEPSSAERP